jgi:2'-5' RNA ligase
VLRFHVFSLNAPVPGTVARLAAELRPELTPFERVRDRHTLLVKRFEERSLDRVRKRLRGVLRPTPAFQARVTGVNFFADPPSGSAPVVYLVVDSPGLRDVHERLVEAFGGVEGLEGPDYVPHVTLARGGELADARRLRDREVQPVTWTVSRLQFWNARYREVVGSVGLPVQ